MRCPDCGVWNENEASICAKCEYDFVTRQTRSGSFSAGLYDYLQFRKLITPGLIKFCYFAGAILITLMAFTVMLESFPRPDYVRAYNPVMGGIVILFVGHVLWRMLCEWIILLFSMHEAMVSLDEQAQSLKAGGRH